MATALKPEVLSIATGAGNHVARCITVSPTHHIAVVGKTLVELVNGEVRRTAEGPHVTAAHALPDGRLVLLGLHEVAVWEGDRLTSHAFTDGSESLASLRAVRGDGENILLVGQPPNAGVAYRAGLDGVVFERHAQPGSHVFEDGRSAFFLESSPASMSVTAWQGGDAKPLGSVAAAGSPHPYATPAHGRFLISDDRLALYLFGDGEARALGVAAPNPSLDESGFVATAVGSVARARGVGGLVCRWRYDGTVAWEVPVHTTGLRTVRSGNVFGAYDRDRIVLVDARDGRLIADATLKLTRAESIESIAATARGAIVVNARHREKTKYAHLVQEGEAPVVLKHDGVAGAMPFGERMATWAGATDDAGTLTLHVWNVAPA